MHNQKRIKLHWVFWDECKEIQEIPELYCIKKTLVLGQKKDQ